MSRTLAASGASKSPPSSSSNAAKSTPANSSSNSSKNNVTATNNNGAGSSGDSSFESLLQKVRYTSLKDTSPSIQYQQPQLKNSPPRQQQQQQQPPPLPLSPPPAGGMGYGPNTMGGGSTNTSPRSGNVVSSPLHQPSIMSVKLSRPPGMLLGAGSPSPPLYGGSASHSNKNNRKNQSRGFPSLDSPPLTSLSPSVSSNSNGAVNVPGYRVKSTSPPAPVGTPPSGKKNTTSGGGVNKGVVSGGGYTPKSIRNVSGSGGSTLQRRHTVMQSSSTPSMTIVSGGFGRGRVVLNQLGGLTDVDNISSSNGGSSSDKPKESPSAVAAAAGLHNLQHLSPKTLSNLGLSDSSPTLPSSHHHHNTTEQSALAAKSRNSAASTGGTTGGQFYRPRRSQTVSYHPKSPRHFSHSSPSPSGGVAAAAGLFGAAAGIGKSPKLAAPSTSAYIAMAGSRPGNVLASYNIAATNSEFNLVGGGFHEGFGGLNSGLAIHQNGIFIDANGNEILPNSAAAAAATTATGVNTSAAGITMVGGNSGYFASRRRGGSISKQVGLVADPDQAIRIPSIMFEKRRLSRRNTTTSNASHHSNSNSTVHGDGENSNGSKLTSTKNPSPPPPQSSSSSSLLPPTSPIDGGDNNTNDVGSSDGGNEDDLENSDAMLRLKQMISNIQKLGTKPNSKDLSSNNKSSNVMPTISNASAVANSNS
ncbi:hypothetical protein H4219_002575 [Mycoemilia scoparia]|uniref:Uncharacterized protein n=1 Tax=Mycoemilia scoparia TaxID=417184 RepID=A0A9W8DU73_9FUNG|nr:hypothetical protein H4219_002575 [Mycoemilia scoparia]